MSTLTVTGLETLLDGIGLRTPVPYFAAADVLTKPLDIGRAYFADILSSLVECDPVTAFNSIQSPNNIDNGYDLAAVLPKLSHDDDPEDLGFDLMQRFPQCPLFLLPIPDGAQLRVIHQPKTLPRLLLSYITDRKAAYGQDTSLGLRDPSSPDLGRKKLVIEFSSPNIVREFEGKHLRSTILGSHIAKLYGSMGWDVVKINYLGDWGKPIGLLGVGWEKFGSEELFESDPAGHLLDVYHKIDDMLEVERVARKKARDEGKDTTEFESQGLFAEQNAFLKRMEDGEETAVTFSERVRTVNIEDYSKLYGRLNVSFDDYSGESQASQEVMTEVEEILRSKGLCEESGHSLTIDLKKHGGKSGTAKIRDTSGSSTYLLRDLAGVLSRARKYSFDKMIYVVAADNADHFSQVFKVLELMDMHDLASKLQHIQFSKVSEMSKRLGRGHMLGEILDQCKVAMWKSLETNPEKAAPFSTTKDAAAAIGISALLAQEVSATRSKNHAFDISRMTSFEPGTGPNLQYWYARLRAGLKGASCNGDHSNEDLTSIQQKDHVALLRLLAMYPDVTRIAYDKLEPATIMAYLSNVTGYLSSCLGAVDQGNAFDQAQILLFEAARIVLENGMELVGITPATG